MKNKFILAATVTIVFSGFAFFSITQYLIESPKDSPRHSIDGFAIDDYEGNVRHYPIDKLDEMSCEDYLSIWDSKLADTEQADILKEKLFNCMEGKEGLVSSQDP